MTDLSKPAAFDTQIGGNHYTRWGCQPFEFAMINGLHPAQTKIIKYVMRHDIKGGAEDIRKALHVCDLWIAFNAQHPALLMRIRALDIPNMPLAEFYRLNPGMGARERDIIDLVCVALTRYGIDRVRSALQDLLRSAYPAWGAL